MRDERIIWVAHADDHQLVRGAVGRLIEAETDMRLAGSYPDAESAIAALQTHHADVLVLDMSMPGMGGLSALVHLRAVAPHVRVVMLSSHDFHTHGKRALEAGASAYLQKPVGASELTAAIRNVAAKT